MSDDEAPPARAERQEIAVEQLICRVRECRRISERVHGPGAGPVPVSGPRDSSSRVRGRARIRFVNQLESGTSSIVLMFCARTSGVGSPGRLNRLMARSTAGSIVHSWALDAS